MPTNGYWQIGYWKTGLFININSSLNISEKTQKALNNTIDQFLITDNQ
jgi:hypothetical protein